MIFNQFFTFQDFRKVPLLKYDEGNVIICTIQKSNFKIVKRKLINNILSGILWYNELSRNQNDVFWYFEGMNSNRKSEFRGNI